MVKPTTLVSAPRHHLWFHFWFHLSWPAPVPATLVSLASESVEMSAKRQSTGACELLRVDCINGTSFQLAQGLRIFCGLCACGAGAIVATVRRGGRIICQFYLQRHYRRAIPKILEATTGDSDALQGVVFAVVSIRSMDHRSSLLSSRWKPLLLWLL
jgi:hypothetical protein